MKVILHYNKEKKGDDYMSKQKNKYIPKPFESAIGAARDTSANIYMSMLKSDAFMSLSASQKVLYLCCKSQQYGMPVKERSKYELGDKLEYFTFSEHQWKKQFKLYSEGNRTKFYKDMNRLIEVGLIDCVHSGQSSRTKIYTSFPVGGLPMAQKVLKYQKK